MARTFFITLLLLVVLVTARKNRNRLSTQTQVNRAIESRKNKEMRALRPQGEVEMSYSGWALSLADPASTMERSDGEMWTKFVYRLDVLADSKNASKVEYLTVDLGCGDIPVADSGMGEGTDSLSGKTGRQYHLNAKKGSSTNIKLYVKGVYSTGNVNFTISGKKAFAAGTIQGPACTPGAQPKCVLGNCPKFLQLDTGDVDSFPERDNATSGPIFNASQRSAGSSNYSNYSVINGTEDLLDGTAMLLAVDDFEQRTTKVIALIEDDNHQTYELEMDDADPTKFLQSGQRITIERSVRNNGKIRSNMRGTRIRKGGRRHGKATTQALMSGTKTSLIVPVNCLDTTNQWADSSKWSEISQVIGTELGDYFKEISRGNVDWSGHKIIPAITLNQNCKGTCDYSSIANNVNTQLIAQGYTLSDYTAVTYIVPPGHSCSWAGLANVGCNAGCKVWLADTIQADVWAHELGHTMGLRHANKAGQEYEDYSCIMGLGINKMRFANTPHMMQMEWLTKTKDITSGGSWTGFVVAEEESESSVLTGEYMAIVIPDSASSKKWMIGYRNEKGADATMPSAYAHRTSVTEWGGATVSTTLLASLANGEKYTHPTAGWSVLQLNGQDKKAQVSVTTKCAKQPPAVEVITPIVWASTAGQSVDFKVKVTNNDLMCGTDPSNFALTLKLTALAGWSFSGTRLSTTLTPGQSDTLTVTVTAPSTAGDNTYNIEFSAAPTASGVSSTSGWGIYQIGSTKPESCANQLMQGRVGSNSLINGLYSGGTSYNGRASFTGDNGLFIYYMSGYWYCGPTMGGSNLYSYLQDSTAQKPAESTVSWKIYSSGWVTDTKIKVTCADNKCAPNPCQNDGRCENAAGNAICHCATGYLGDRCQNAEDNACNANQCKNGAACSAATGGYTCTCKAGYSGTYCSVAADKCAEYTAATGDQACLNGGSCANKIASGAITGYQCTCATGFSGTNCATNIDDCVGKNCGQGTCVDLVNGYKCSCNTGYTGASCATAITSTPSDPCSPNPCTRGTCSKADSTYKCTCPAGYSGDKCQLDIDDCAAQPCGAYGSCTDKVNGYTCACIAGYTGTLCQTNVDECAASPCKNGGTCVDEVNAFSCQCPSGFTGDTCASTDCQNLVVANAQNNAGAINAHYDRQSTLYNSRPYWVGDNGKYLKWMSNYNVWGITSTLDSTGIYGYLGQDVATPDKATAAWSTYNNGWVSDTITVKCDADACAGGDRCNRQGTCSDGLGMAFSCFCNLDYGGIACEVSGVQACDIRVSGRTDSNTAINDVYSYQGVSNSRPYYQGKANNKVLVHSGTEWAFRSTLDSTSMYAMVTHTGTHPPDFNSLLVQPKVWDGSQWAADANVKLVYECTVNGQTVVKEIVYKTVGGAAGDGDASSTSNNFILGLVLGGAGGLFVAGLAGFVVVQRMGAAARKEEREPEYLREQL